MRPEETTRQRSSEAGTTLSTFASTTGKILGISYPVLALSTGARALYQLFLKEGVTNYLAPSLTAVAAAVYLIAAVGFTVQKKWAWWVSLIALAFETLMVLLVGTLSLVIPDVIGSTAWGHFGADYAFFPLIQPVLGLIWLLHPQTRRAYQIRKR